MTECTIADVQNDADTRNIAIDKVGIKSIRHPVKISTRNDTNQHTIAEFSMYVSLPQHLKGTHMSRFIDILNQQDKEINIDSFANMLDVTVQKLEADAAYIEMSFPFFVNKSAPVTGVSALLDYGVTLIGKVHNDVTEIYTKILIPVTSLCPCSKKISDDGAHSQRSHITLTVLCNSLVWIEDLIDIVESNASSELYALLKRPDEKFVTERAYNNPKFVEDVVRDIAQVLNNDDKIDFYSVEAENFESIHNHSAYALIENDKRQNNTP